MKEVSFWSCARRRSDADLALALALLSHVTYLLPLAGTGLALESLRMWRDLPDEG